MTKKQLDGLSVFALRDIARRVGVSMPTSKKKSDLIKEILEIEAGTRQPYFPAKKQGRPPKETGYAYVGSFDPGLSSAYPEFSKRQSLNQQSQQFNYDEIKTAVGYVEITKDNTAFLWSVNEAHFNTYFIPNEMMREWALHYGDHLSVEVGYENRNPIVKNIFVINGVPKNNYAMNKIGKTYFDIAHEDRGEKVNFSGKKFANMEINVADNIFVFGDDNRQNTNFAIDLINSAIADKKFYINCAVIGKDLPSLSRINEADLFISELTENSSVIERTLSLALASARRGFEMGENVLIVIDGLDAIADIKNGQTTFAKSLLSLPKSNNKFGSITVISILPENMTGFNRLADKRFKIENDKATKI